MIFVALLLILSTTYALSVDCPNVIQLAQGLGMQTARPAIWSALQIDCCTTSGVICDGNQRVTQINWYTTGLNGTINGTAIPSSLLRLDLNGNSLSGSITSSLPIGLRELYLYGNQMSGDLPSFPSTLQYFGLGYPGYPGNHFTGSLRLNQPLWLHINDNWITDVVIQDSSVLGTGGYYCDLSNNPLLGNLNIAGLTRCFKNGLYSASLLPVTRSTVATQLTTTKLTTSVLGTTTQSESIEMIKTTLKSTDDSTTMETTTNTALGYITAQQTSSIEMSVTGTSTATSSMGTVAFVQEVSGFDVNFGMMVRCIFSAMLLTAVFMKTPFVREFKRMRNKGMTTTTTSALEF